MFLKCSPSWIQGHNFADYSSSWAAGLPIFCWYQPTRAAGRSLGRFAAEKNCKLWERSESVLDILNSAFWQIQKSRTKVTNLFRTSDAAGLCRHFSLGLGWDKLILKAGCFRYRIETRSDQQDCWSRGKLKSAVKAAAKIAPPLISSFCPVWRRGCFSSCLKNLLWILDDDLCLSLFYGRIHPSIVGWWTYPERRHIDG